MLLIPPWPYPRVILQHVRHGVIVISEFGEVGAGRVAVASWRCEVASILLLEFWLEEIYSCSNWAATHKKGCNIAYITWEHCQRVQSPIHPFVISETYFRNYTGSAKGCRVGNFILFHLCVWALLSRFNCRVKFSRSSFLTLIMNWKGRNQFLTCQLFCKAKLRWAQTTHNASGIFNRHLKI